ncbi:putative endo-beta-1,4-glucanase D [Madurella mycetomatis]|uniref:lytic cellulose monooxygenase (C4-dehydrogenating) n=1 Tax=Madurella mycetomatis TaxID=100816 RepID=A0A175WDG2_9PEZI|nr:putative endo-beta-1,4-glucanase D [Madurella mycetomatis]
MRLPIVGILSIVLAPGAFAHNIHGILLVNGTESPKWKYVRDVAPYLDDSGWPEGNEFPKTPPQFDINHPDITCGRSAFDAASLTETADVLAGSEVGFRVSYSAGGNGPYGGFYHHGPGQIYLSKAPNNDLENYRGDGDWFKIAYAGPAGNNKWLLRWEPDFNFTIPETTPPGRYLMRIENFMPTNRFNYSQWFINCAHINIIGPGGGTPTGFAKFPGTYKIEDPGILIPDDQLVNGGKVANEDMRLLEYKPPGPAVWTG